MFQLHFQKLPAIKIKIKLTQNVVLDWLFYYYIDRLFKKPLLKIGRLYYACAKT